MYVDIDLDGVLGSSLEYIFGEVRNLYKSDPKYCNFTLFDMHSYDFNDVRKDVRQTIFKQFNNPDLMQHFKFYSYAVPLLKYLRDWAAEHNCRVRIHTLVFNKDSCANRIAYLTEWLTENDLEDITVKVDVGTKFIDEDVVLYIEDYLDNLVKSKAQCKILLNQNYNNTLEQGLLKTMYNIDKVNVCDFTECFVEEIKKVLENYNK